MEQPNSVKTEMPAEASQVENTSTTTTQEIDAQSRIAQLEAEKAKIEEERDNYRTGLLKAKNKMPVQEFNDNGEETDEERVRRITREELASSKLAEIAREQDLIIKQALKENKELKLANLNKPSTTPTSGGSHTESVPVTSTLITPEQIASFKAKGWTDQDIEKYKKNLNKGIGGFGR